MTNLALNITDEMDLFNATSDSIFLIATDGKILDANKATLDLLGMPKVYITKLHVQDLVAEITENEEDICAHVGLDSLITRGLLKSAPLSLISSDREHIPVLLTASQLKKSQHTMGVVCIAKDLRSQLKADDILKKERESNQKEMQELIFFNESVIRWISDMLVVVDKDGQIIRSNMKVQESLGYTEKELEDKSFFDLIPKTGFIRHYSIKNAQDLIELAAQRELVEQDALLTTKEGAEFPVSITASTIPTAAGETSGVILLAKDGRESKLIRKLRVSQHQLVQSAKLASLGELSGGIAHEINNPLSIISGFLELIEENIQDHLETINGFYPKFPQHLTRIKDAGNRIHIIMRHVKDFCRMSSGEFVRFDINSAIRKSFVLLQQQLSNRGITLELDLSEDELEVLCDPTKIEHVFVNLITNARDALTEKYDRRGGRLSVTTTLENDLVKIAFIDDGTGIRPEILDNVFDPFFTTKDTGEGAGLGLSTCLGIIQEHGGDITCINNALGGVTVEITLKQAEAK